MTGGRLDWAPLAGYAPPASIAGLSVRLTRLAPDHAPDLWASLRGHDAAWDWLADGPFHDPDAFAAWVARRAASEDPAFYGIHDGATWTGVASLMRIDRTHGVIEIGNILFSPALQRTRAATEAILRLADHAFAAGFRRLEWKCNALNLPSRRAARRYGFTEEGTFRNHMVVKGRNRDTTWFSILDGEWPPLRGAVERWLDPSNFDAAGRQRVALSTLTAAARTG